MELDNVLSYVLTGGCAAAGIKLIETLIVWVLNRKAKKSDDEVERERKKEKEKEVEYENLVKTVESLKTANRIVMYDRIKHLCRSYLSSGEVAFNDLEDLIDMHSCYHNDLGGNGNLDTLMELVKDLPVRR